MRSYKRDRSVLSKGWTYLIALFGVTAIFAAIFFYISTYDSHNQMLLPYVALLYAIFILYLMIVTSAYYLRIEEPSEIRREVQKLRSSISEAFKKPR